MLCPNCGEKNTLNAAACAKCGYPLHAPADEDAEEQATIHFSPIRQTDEPDSFEEPSEEDAQEANIPSIDIEDAPEYLTERRRKSNSIFTIIIWVLLLGLLTAGGIFGYQWIKGLVDPSELNFLQPQATTPVIKTPKISVQTDETGEQYIYAEFYGAPGDSIYISATDHYYEFTEDTLTLFLYKEDLFEAARVFEKSTETVYLSPSYVTGDKKYPITVSPLTLDIPQAALTVISPEQDTQEVFQDSYNIKLKVTPESKVVINGLNLSDRVDRFGQLIYAVNISPDTVNPFEISVTAPYAIAQTRTVTISRSALPVVLSLDKGNPSKVTSDTVTITGSTEAGAVISSNLPIVSQEFNALYNSFTVILQLDAYGSYPVEIIATHPAKGVSKLVTNVLYWPDEDTYTRKARVYESMLSQNPSAYKGIIFLFKEVTVQEVLGDNPTLFTVNMGTEEAPEILLFEYLGTKTIEEGDIIKIFADVEGPEDGMAKLNARFIY